MDKIYITEGEIDALSLFESGIFSVCSVPNGANVGNQRLEYLDNCWEYFVDKKEIILSGFDDHDTHHAHSAYTADESGAIYMEEGVFLHTNVETSYGPVRATNGGFYRYTPQRHKLERTAQLAIPNPWGVAFDDYGQDFFLHTSGPSMNILIKLTCLVGLVIAPILGGHGSDEHEGHDHGSIETPAPEVTPSAPTASFEEA